MSSESPEHRSNELLAVFPNTSRSDSSGFGVYVGRSPHSSNTPQLGETHQLDTAFVSNWHAKSMRPLAKRRVTVNILPDDVLLQIFDFDRVNNHRPFYSLLPWHRLVHVCRRWRFVVFASPNFLDLRLVCGPGTRMELLGVWPPLLPIIVKNELGQPMPENYDFDAAIMQRDRVCQITLFHLSDSQLQRLARATQGPFPALIHVSLQSGHNNSHHAAPPLPDGFLGGAFPHLQFLALHSIPFPALPKLLLSATDLVHLALERVPHNGYISPEAVVTCLAVMANLKHFTLEFQSPQPRPDLGRRRPSLPTQFVLRALTHLRFRGVNEYLEDLVARIDAPVLGTVWITFFHQLIFDTPRLAQFMRCTIKFKALNEARVFFNKDHVLIEFFPPTQTSDIVLMLIVSCSESDWQLSSPAQICTSSFPPVYMVEHLYVDEDRFSNQYWQDDIDNTQWLELFQPFTDVKNLYLSKKFVSCVATTLQDLTGERVTEVLPILESLFLEEFRPSGPVQEALGRFVDARRLSGHSITVSQWDGARRVMVG